MFGSAERQDRDRGTIGAGMRHKPSDHAIASGRHDDFRGLAQRLRQIAFLRREIADGVTAAF